MRSIGGFHDAPIMHPLAASRILEPSARLKRKLTNNYKTTTSTGATPRLVNPIASAADPERSMSRPSA